MGWPDAYVCPVERIFEGGGGPGDVYEVQQRTAAYAGGAAGIVKQRKTEHRHQSSGGDNRLGPYFVDIDRGNVHLEIEELV